MSNPMQPLDPNAPPPAVKQWSSLSNPAGFHAVSPPFPGPAAYDIQANLGAVQSEIAGAFAATNREMAAGVLYAQGPRQAQTEALLSSPQGFGLAGYDIDAGTTAGWPNNVEPGSALETPDQGQPGYPQSSTM